MLFEKTLSTAIYPSRSSQDAAGFDLYSPYDITIYPHSTVLCNTGLKVNLPKGFYGRITDRSGIALRTDLFVKGGVIDGDYEGNIGVILCNLGNKEYDVKKGYRIAQIIIEKYYIPEMYLKDCGYRGYKGFGMLSGIW